MNGLEIFQDFERLPSAWTYQSGKSMYVYMYAKLASCKGLSLLHYDLIFKKISENRKDSQTSSLNTHTNPEIVEKIH